jgi:hypothetical protein
MVSPRRCTSLGARCLKTSAASSSPSDISRMAASSRPESSLASMVRRMLGLRPFAVDPAAHDVGHRGRVLAASARAASSLFALTSRCLPAPGARGAGSGRRRPPRRAGCPARARRRAAGRQQRASAPADELEHDHQRHQRQRQRRGGRAQQVQQPGLLPQRRFIGRAAGSARKGALTTLTDVAALGLLKPMPCCTSAVSFSSSSRSAACSWSCPWHRCWCGG